MSMSEQQQMLAVKSEPLRRTNSSADAYELASPKKYSHSISLSSSTYANTKRENDKAAAAVACDVVVEEERTKNPLEDWRNLEVIRERSVTLIISELMDVMRKDLSKRLVENYSFKLVDDEWDACVAATHQQHQQHKQLQQQQQQQQQQAMRSARGGTTTHTQHQQQQQQQYHSHHHYHQPPGGASISSSSMSSGSPLHHVQTINNNNNNNNNNNSSSSSRSQSWRSTGGQQYHHHNNNNNHYESNSNPWVCVHNCVLFAHCVLAFCLARALFTSTFNSNSTFLKLNNFFITKSRPKTTTDTPILNTHQL